MDACVRGRRALPHRGPDASPAGSLSPPPHSRRGALLHRPATRAEEHSRPLVKSAAGRLEGQAHAIDAIPQVSRGVVALACEHVTKVGIAPRAEHLNTL